MKRIPAAEECTSGMSISPGLSKVMLTDMNRLRIILIAFLVVMLGLVFPGSVQSPVNEQDSLALVDLYNTTDSPNWTHHETG